MCLTIVSLYPLGGAGDSFRKYSGNMWTLLGLDSMDNIGDKHCTISFEEHIKRVINSVTIYL